MADTGIEPGVFGGLIGGMIAVGYGLWVAKKRKWSEKDLAKIQARETFDVPFQAAELLEWLENYARHNAIRIEEVNVAPNRIVLGDLGGANDYGFFYPIQLIPLEGGQGTRVEIGALSRGSQWKFATRKYLAKFSARLQAAIRQSTSPGVSNPW